MGKDGVSYPFPMSKIAGLCCIGNTTSVFLPAPQKTFFTSHLRGQCFRFDQVAAAERCSGWDRGMLRLGREPAAGTEVVLWEWDFMPIFLLPQGGTTSFCAPHLWMEASLADLMPMENSAQ